MTQNKAGCRFGTGELASQAGQASVFLLLILGTFLLASVGFAVDLSNMWFHRQAAQSAADAACVAGAMDMLYLQRHYHQQPWLYPRYIRRLRLVVIRRAMPVCTIQRLHSHHLCCRVEHEHRRRRCRGQLDFPHCGHRRHRSLRHHVSVPQCCGAGEAGYLVHGSGRGEVATVGASCTCGLPPGIGGAPLVILNPTVGGALTLSGGAHIVICRRSPNQHPGELVRQWFTFSQFFEQRRRLQWWKWLSHRYQYGRAVGNRRKSGHCGEVRLRTSFAAATTS